MFRHCTRVFVLLLLVAVIQCLYLRDKPGVCPSPAGSFGICPDECDSDWHCLGSLKCCNSGCGFTCLPPPGDFQIQQVLQDKPGTCPLARAQGDMGICVEDCRSDTHCGLQEKCCENSCGGFSCQEPVEDVFIQSIEIVKPGSCPVVAEDQMGICEHQCSSDDGCGGNLKCCSTGCGRTCQMPPEDVLIQGPNRKLGSCPPIRDYGFKICHEKCVVDDDCTGFLLCCDNGCGHICQPPVGRGGKRGYKRNFH